MTFELADWSDFLLRTAPQRNERSSSMAYRVNTESHGDRTVYTLHDDATGASAAVLPSFGFNLFSLKLPAAGAVREVLATAPASPRIRRALPVTEYPSYSLFPTGSAADAITTRARIISFPPTTARTQSMASP